MRNAAALRRFEPEVEAGTTTSSAAAPRRHPKLYLASRRRDDGTVVAYDNLGRRIIIDNPDTGKTETVYDLASNVTQKITANLRAQSRQIAYDYDFTRLKSVTYPVNTGNNVTYTYGAPGAANNTAGRITQITSQMGTEERQYVSMANYKSSRDRRMKQPTTV